MTDALHTAFWIRVEKRSADECWPWRGCIRPDGYGQFDFEKRRYIASRISLEIATGVPLGKLRACHHCDNPSCVNPGHLFAGSDRDNALDRSAKLRGRGQSSTHCRHGHRFDEANTYRRPNGNRQCRTCNRQAVQRLQARKRGQA